MIKIKQIDSSFVFHCTKIFSANYILLLYFFYVDVMNYLRNDFFLISNYIKIFINIYKYISNKNFR